MLRAVPLLVLAALAANAAVASGGASVSTDRPSYGYVGLGGLEQVNVTFRNDGATSVHLADSAPFVVRDEEGVVFRAGGTQGFIEVPPGGAYSVSWNMRTNCLDVSTPQARCAGLALPGEYTLVWDYLPTPTTSASTATSFAIRGI